jgi:hypothetical protein
MKDSERNNDSEEINITIIVVICNEGLEMKSCLLRNLLYLSRDQDRVI